MRPRYLLNSHTNDFPFSRRCLSHLGIGPQLCVTRDWHVWHVGTGACDTWRVLEILLFCYWLVLVVSIPIPMSPTFLYFFLFVFGCALINPVTPSLQKEAKVTTSFNIWNFVSIWLFEHFNTLIWLTLFQKFNSSFWTENE